MPDPDVRPQPSQAPASGVYERGAVAVELSVRIAVGSRPIYPSDEPGSHPGRYGRSVLINTR
jgi:hypothetical protein